MDNEQVQSELPVCPACEGSGLKDQFNVCSVCNGTGKAKLTSEFEPGTVVIRKGQGTFVVNDAGEEVQV